MPQPKTAKQPKRASRKATAGDLVGDPLLLATIQPISIRPPLLRPDHAAQVEAWLQVLRRFAASAPATQAAGKVA